MTQTATAGAVLLFPESRCSVQPCVFAQGPLGGHFQVPGDKSISHRALVVASFSREPVRIDGLNDGLDVRATIRCLRELGVEIDADGRATTVSARDLHDALAVLDCANSGSTARMLMGVCAGAGIRAAFDGDASLRRRPMEPVAAQLRAFGARIETTNGTLPAEIDGTRHPQTRRFILLAPSAQVKTALLFAGLFGGVPIAVRGDRGSRDHTERLLRYCGADIAQNGSAVELRSPPMRFPAFHVAGDFSTASVYIVAAIVAARSSIVIEGVGINSTRTGLLDALMQMGARIQLMNEREQCGEPIADIAVQSSRLAGCTFGSDLALRAIDEVPLLAVAAAFAHGETRIAGLRELRFKESDRLAATEAMLKAVNIDCEAAADALLVRGGSPQSNGHEISTYGDHRLALAAAALAAGCGPLRVDDGACIAVSARSFLSGWPLLRRAPM